MDPATTADYEMLGLSQSATLDEVKSAYRRLSAKVHPDVGGTDSLFRQLTEAYERVLADLQTGKRSEGHEAWDPFANVRTTWEPKNTPWEDATEEAAGYSSAEGPSGDAKRSNPASSADEMRTSVRPWNALFLLGRGPSTTFSAVLLFALALLAFFQIASSAIPDPLRGILAVGAVVLAVGRIAALPSRLKR